VFLKSLTLRGFKSFADKTLLEFEPGVTVVVGPNGSGKSNLVDAVAWVLGAQGPRSLRGGKMDDVIFAGTPDRPALGRAEVSLTIDNTAGLLPIDFSEVTITRTLFRNGDSEYQINGAPCRLLDIQELLSDTGIGRQQHVIVGQGQLDTVLNARPEDRRGIVEEAAGVLKYRKRRERAERRLEATEGNLLRLNDLLREVRRGLNPLQRQADAARRHDGLVSEVRAIRLHLVGHEIAGLQTRASRLGDQRVDLAQQDESLRAGLRELDIAVVDTERALTFTGDDDVADALVRAESLRERAKGLAALIAEKRRGLERELAIAADGGVIETLVADALALRSELSAVEADAATLGDQAADVEATEKRVAGERGAVLAAREALGQAEARWRSLETEAGRWRARAEALALALDAARDGAAAAALTGLGGVVGPLVDQLEIEPGTEAAVAVGLGDAMRAVVVDGDASARAALERLKGGDLDALLVVTGVRGAGPRRDEAAPAGTQPLANYVRGPAPGLDAALASLLDGIVLVDGDWQAALDVAVAHPELAVVTVAGDRVGGRGPWRVGGERTAGIRPAALAEAETRADTAEAERAGAEAEVAALRDQAGRDAGELEAREAAVATLRRELEVRAAAVEERRAMLTRRLTGVDQRLARDPEAQAAAEQQRAELMGRAGAYDAVARALAGRITVAEGVLERLREHRRRQSEAASAAGARLDALRTERAGLEQKLTGVREQAGRREVEEAETKLRLENAIEKLRADFDCEPAAALDAPAPEVPAGTTLAGHARELERDLRLMGPINPLALEEYESLQERYTFLQGQLEDVKSSRRDLARVIKAVDREIITVFEHAFADVSEHFSALFATLFPGGSGRVFLTDPDDLLNTGIEIDARPSGKNVRRLSLLSGGERSLTALAFLFAVFRARPSPFYLLDEVEAALDDVNLHRFLDLVHEFRDEAQLVIVSHQKRTMEAADCLYGVSMPPGGSSKIVSQRLTEDLVIP
jgi:chromosome segregation protein